MPHPPESLRPLILCAALVAGCGPAPSAGPMDLLWPERQTLFRIDGARTHIEAYAIRGGITPLGIVPLPDTLCPDAMALDTETSRLWLWSAAGGVMIDARSLKVVREWQSAVPLALDEADVAGRALHSRLSMVSLPLPPQPECHVRQKTLQAMRTPAAVKN